MPKVVSLPDPRLRLDILLLRLAECGTKWAEQKLHGIVGSPVSLWDGDGGVGAVLEQKIDELGVPREQLTPAIIAAHVGFLGKKPRKLRKVG